MARARKQEQKNFTVYLSSTLNDLRAERQAIKEALSDECIVRESYRANESELIKSCLDDVAACDLYIGVLGLRYGYVPKNEVRNPKKLSITELEYQHAVGKRISRFIFVKHEDAIPYPQTDAKSKEHPQERADEFRARAADGTEQRPALFRTVDDLKLAVVKAFNDFKAARTRPATTTKRKSNVPKASTAASIRTAYLDWLREECERVVLLGANSRERQNVRLGEVYVPAVTAARSEWRERTLGKVDLKKRDFDLLIERLGKESLYVPGAPGAGKSTFCRWLALAVATGDIPAHAIGGPKEFEEKLHADLKRRFPLLCRLREWSSNRDAAYLAGSGHWRRKQLEEGLCGWLDRARPGGLTAAAFRETLDRGDCMLILDGVDEIPEQIGAHTPRRNFLTGLADAIGSWAKLGNRVLLTSRPYGLSDTERGAVRLPEVELAGLPPALQTLFVHRWYAAAGSKGGDSKARGLLQHIDARRDLDALRPNPMLLTALCIKYDEGQRLPGDMFRLYDSVVDQVLYKRYESEQLRDLARRRLEAIALRMHRGTQSDPRTSPAPETDFNEIERALADFAQTDPTTERGGTEAAVNREELLSNSGLLLPRATKTAAFYHLSFQEFLAATRLKQLEEVPEKLIATYGATPAWRRTLTFLFGAIAEGRPEKALADFSSLVGHLEPDALSRNASPALLLADCLELGHARGWNLDQYADPLREGCEHALHTVKPPARAYLWRTLGSLGFDNRPGIGVYDALPDIDWVEIPAGKFKYGRDRNIASLPAFRIARYPVTNTQFQCFIDERGYNDDRWWAWPKLREPPIASAFGTANHPRERVSWFDAMAFCKWLEARLRERGKIGRGDEIRLPTEPQWEKAARGEDGREFPWGNKYRSGYANINETPPHHFVGEYNVGQTSAVGIYPTGESPYGVLDLAGNVWEWSYDPIDPRRGKADSVERVLRGGSWEGDSADARAFDRVSDFPNHRDDAVGFRVVRVSPIVEPLVADALNTETLSRVY